MWCDDMCCGLMWLVWSGGCYHVPVDGHGLSVAQTEAREIVVGDHAALAPDRQSGSGRGTGMRRCWGVSS